MDVERLPKSFTGNLLSKCHDEFFDKLRFIKMKRKKGVKGENDADSLVLVGTGVACTGFKDVREVVDCFKSYMVDFGYYEVDNCSKYSICKNTANNLI